MKKYFISLLVLLILTGCCNINNASVEDIVSLSLKDKSKATMPFKGYKLYIPSNMRVANDSFDNIVLLSNKDKYYLYVDVLGYYNKSTNDYRINEEKESFYSKILDNGYILVTKYKEKYFVEVMYNYAKIEVITSNYREALTKSLILLNNIKYNDNIINSLVGKNILSYDEEKYNLLGPSNKTTDFLEWVEEEEDKKDEELIEIDS